MGCDVALTVAPYGHAGLRAGRCRCQNYAGWCFPGCQVGGGAPVGTVPSGAGAVQTLALKVLGGDALPRPGACRAADGTAQLLPNSLAGPNLPLNQPFWPINPAPRHTSTSPWCLPASLAQMARPWTGFRGLLGCLPGWEVGSRARVVVWTSAEPPSHRHPWTGQCSTEARTRDYRWVM